MVSIDIRGNTLAPQGAAVGQISEISDFLLRSTVSLARLRFAIHKGLVYRVMGRNGGSLTSPIPLIQVGRRGVSVAQ